MPTNEETKIFKLLNKLKRGLYNSEPNYTKIPVTRLVYREKDVELFNKIYLYFKNSNYKPIKRTPSGGISNDVPLSQRFQRFDIRILSSFIELTIIDPRGLWRIQVAPGRPSSELGDRPVLAGHQAYFKFEGFLKKNNIDLNKYAIENGKEVNQTIQKPLIFARHYAFIVDKEFNKVHHIDYHNSYPAGLANTYPEFKEPINYLYMHRKTNPEYKDILNMAIGFFHSKLCRYKFAHLSKAAIEDSNKRVLELSERVLKAGGKVLLYNTDGFWYQGEIYHGEGEGDGLGEWHNDHINCRFRMKSVGCYEYEENDRYYPVVRGLTKLDKIKNREEWQWGDIYRDDAEILTYFFNENKGLVENKEDN